MKAKLLKHLRSKYEVVASGDQLTLVYKNSGVIIPVEQWRYIGNRKEYRKTLIELDHLALITFLEHYKRNKLTEHFKIWITKNF